MGGVQLGREIGIEDEIVTDTGRSQSSVDLFFVINALRLGFFICLTTHSCVSGNDMDMGPTNVWTPSR